jgi:hypothetical protein
MKEKIIEILKDHSVFCADESGGGYNAIIEHSFEELAEEIDKLYNK